MDPLYNLLYLCTMFLGFLGQRGRQYELTSAGERQIKYGE
jgi:hypothetical protein